jgi:hypothetical protein
MEIKLTEKECLDILHTAMCNYPNYGNCFIKAKSTKEALDAKEQILKENENSVVCREDVWLNIIKNGGTLLLKDEEGGEDEWELNIKTLQEKMPLLPLKNLTNFVNETDDADDADIAIQILFIGEILFA